MTNHISTVGEHYKNKTLAWDVVNEAIDDTDYNLRASVWNNITATDDYSSYVDLAYQLARTADPSAKLFYNDYNVASMDGWSAGKSDAMFDMVKSMVDRNVPIDGVGFQLHVGTGYDMIDGLKKNMQRYHDIGIEVHITGAAEAKRHQYTHTTITNSLPLLRLASLISQNSTLPTKTNKRRTRIACGMTMRSTNRLTHMPPSSPLASKALRAQTLRRGASLMPTLGLTTGPIRSRSTSHTMKNLQLMQ